MADLKISQLAGASTPLAGTEVLSIVQSGSTVKVSVANLTAGRAVASAGGTFSDNFVQSTPSKGVNFSANTPAAGMTSQLLNWYEEGTWTPAFSSSGASFAYNSQVGKYIRIGNLVIASFQIATNGATGGTVTNALNVSGLPFASSVYGGMSNAWQDFALVPTGVTIGSEIWLYQQGTTTQLTPTSAGLSASGKYFAGTITYMV